jgi:hypothetical protein
MEAVLERLRSCGRRTETCQVPSVLCPDNSKDDQEEMEVMVDTFKECLDIMEATVLLLNPEQTEAAVEQKQLLKKQINFDNIRSLKNI